MNSFMCKIGLQPACAMDIPLICKQLDHQLYTGISACLNHFKAPVSTQDSMQTQRVQVAVYMREAETRTRSVCARG
jgi:hypothetical protein